MRVKVQNGTVIHTDSTLCTTCRHSTVIRGRTLDEEMVHCQASPMSSVRITFKVTSCSAYNDERLPSYMQMLEDAWILQPGSKRRPAGFVRSRDLEDEDVRFLMRDLRRHSDE